MLTTLPAALNAEIEVEGRSFLYFGGTAYLGMPADGEFLRQYKAGLDTFGVNNGTSRNNNVQLGIYSAAETYAAAEFGSEGALILSSGYLAAQLCVHYLSGIGTILYAPDCHPALFQKDAVSASGNFTGWTAQVVGEINSSDVQHWVLVSNSLNNLIPEVYDFSFLSKISSSKQVLLLIDDSHGIGIINAGSGAFKGIVATVSGLPNVEVVVVASMAKALGVDAGIILGRQQTISRLKETPVFAGASPPTAAALYAFMQGKPLYAHALKRLRSLQAYVIRGLKNHEAFHFHPEFPVLQSRDEALAERLLAENILISSFPYPDREGPVLNRIVLCSWHKEAHLDRLLAVLNAL